MKNNKFIKLVLSFGLAVLFIFSATIPVTTGYNVKSEATSNQGGSSQRLDGPMDSAWPMFHHDVFHTGRSPYGKSGNWFVEKWKDDIGSLVYSSPAIDKDGTIYIGSNNEYFYAINSNGTLKWSYKTDGGIDSVPAIGEDGTIYVGSEDGYLYSIYPNGTLKWSLTIGDGLVESSPVIDGDGIIYVASVNGCNICAVYPNGTKKWDYVTGDMVWSSPVLDNNGTVYCGSNDGYMYAIFTGNGTLKWKYNTNDWCGGMGATVGDDGVIYFGTADGHFYALYSNGTLKWCLKLGDNVYSSPAISENGTIYVAAYGAYMYSISPEGSVNWKYQLGDAPMSASPAIDKYGIIYIGDWNGVFYAFNPDGTIKWEYKTLDYIFPSAAVGEDGTIYVGAHSDSFTAYLYAIEPINDNPPEKPIITGQVNGKPKTNYTYTASTSDADSDNVSYFFDWGDGTNSSWTEFVPSGSPISISHSWNRQGTYTIKVKAKDVYNLEGDWETLQVTMPKAKSIDHPFLQFLLERFPHAFPILRHLLNL